MPAMTAGIADNIWIIEKLTVCSDKERLPWMLSQKFHYQL
jgi:hypothetical protein